MQQRGRAWQEERETDECIWRGCFAWHSESLARKIHARCEYDKTIQETEGAFTKASLALSAT